MSSNCKIAPQHRRTKNGKANVDIVIEIEERKHLENIIQGVRKIPGVHDVQRLQRV